MRDKINTSTTGTRELTEYIFAIIYEYKQNSFFKYNL